METKPPEILSKEAAFLKKRNAIIKQLEDSKGSKDLENILEKQELFYIIISFKAEKCFVSIKDINGIRNIFSYDYQEDDEFVKNVNLGLLPKDVFDKIVHIFDRFYLPFVIAKIQKFDSSTNDEPESTFKLLQCSKNSPVAPSMTQVVKKPRYPVVNSSTKDFENRKRLSENESEQELNDPEMKILIEKFYSFCSPEYLQNENKKMKMDETQDSDSLDSLVSSVDSSDIQYFAGFLVDKTDDEMETFETVPSATQSSEELLLPQAASHTDSITEICQMAKPHKGLESLRDIMKHALSHIKQEEKIRVYFSFEEQFDFLNDDTAKAQNDDETKAQNDNEVFIE